MSGFRDAIQRFPEVMEVYRMSGQTDYLLRVVAPDIERYDQFYKKLISENRTRRRQLKLRDGADQIHHRVAA